MTQRFGTVERGEGGSYRVRYVRHYPHPPEKVWRALIEPAELKHWFPAAIEGERKQGAKLRFVFEGEPGPPMEGLLRVFDPPRVLEFTWSEDLLRFEITPEPGGSQLAFITTLTVQRVAALRTAAGWHRCLDELGERLGEDIRAADTPWHELYRAYHHAFGPGEYPEFLIRAGERVQNAMHTRGLEGVVFQGKNGVRIELLRATEDAETAEHAAAPDEYLILLEGRYELSLGGGTVLLESGVEFSFPEGFQLRGKIQAGTRLLRAVRG